MTLGRRYLPAQPALQPGAAQIAEAMELAAAGALWQHDVSLNRETLAQAAAKARRAPMTS
jgi:hypothetical protein